MSISKALSIRSYARETWKPVIGLVALGFAVSAAAASAQNWDDPVEDDVSQYESPAPNYGSSYSSSSSRVAYADHVGWGARLGLGFTADPNLFLVDLTIPYDTGRSVSVGPRLQIGLTSDTTYIAPTLSIEYAHDFRSQFSGPFANIRPLIQAGIGFASLSKDDARRPGGKDDNDDVDFLFDIGFGVEYPLTDGFAVASVMDFNIIPRELVDETLIFSWQILQLRVQF